LFPSDSLFLDRDREGEMKTCLSCLAFRRSGRCISISRREIESPKPLSLFEWESHQPARGLKASLVFHGYTNPVSMTFTITSGLPPDLPVRRPRHRTFLRKFGCTEGIISTWRMRVTSARTSGRSGGRIHLEDGLSLSRPVAGRDRIDQLRQTDVFFEVELHLRLRSGNIRTALMRLSRSCPASRWHSNPEAVSRRPGHQCL
jgi:hypothetical protein